MGASTHNSKLVKAPRAVVYAACLDPAALARWRVPDNMTAEVHAFEAREGGTFRMSLTYTDADHSPGGKTAASTDTFQGRFVELVPNERIVERIVFDSPDPRFAGEMTITTRFSDAETGTEITVICEDIPAGIRPEDNATGTAQALQKLAAIVESLS